MYEMQKNNIQRRVIMSDKTKVVIGENGIYDAKTLGTKIVAPNIANIC